jgi:hypothetical protein
LSTHGTRERIRVFDRDLDDGSRIGVSFPAYEAAET